MDERREVIREDPVVERERTTVIETGPRDRGRGALIAVILLVGVIAVAAFLLFGRGLGGGDTDIKVDVKAPDVELPDVDGPDIAPGNKSK